MPTPETPEDFTLEKSKKGKRKEVEVVPQKIEDEPDTKPNLNVLKEVVTKGLDDYIKELSEVAFLNGRRREELAVFSDGSAVPNFKFFKDMVDEKINYANSTGFDYAELYFDYLSRTVKNPDDVWRVVNPPILKWKDDGLKTGDPLLPAKTTLGLGENDCDNISWVAKALLDALGIKQGMDYKARVICSGTTRHAVTIYTDTAGRLCSIDQGYHNKGFSDLAHASVIFIDEGQGKDLDLTEIFSLSPTLSIMETLTPEGEKNYNLLILKPVARHFGEFSPTEIPAQGEHYQAVQVNFLDGSTALYKHGQLTQKHNVDGSWEFFENGELIQKDNVDGSREFFESGELVEKDNTNGAKEVFKGGKLMQKSFPDGSGVSYRADGTIDTIFYKTGSLIDQDGYINGKIQIRFYKSNTKQTPYQKVLYEDDKPVALVTWDNQQVPYKGQPLYEEKK